MKGEKVIKQTLSYKTGFITKDEFYLVNLVVVSSFWKEKEMNELFCLVNLVQPS